MSKDQHSKHKRSNIENTKYSTKYPALSQVNSNTPESFNKYAGGAAIVGRKPIVGPKNIVSLHSDISIQPQHSIASNNINSQDFSNNSKLLSAETNTKKNSNSSIKKAVPSAPLPPNKILLHYQPTSNIMSSIACPKSSLISSKPRDFTPPILRSSVDKNSPQSNTHPSSMFGNKVSPRSNIENKNIIPPSSSDFLLQQIQSPKKPKLFTLENSSNTEVSPIITQPSIKGNATPGCLHSSVAPNNNLLASNIDLRSASAQRKNQKPIINVAPNYMHPNPQQTKGIIAHFPGSTKNRIQTDYKGALQNKYTKGPDTKKYLNRPNKI